MITDLSPVLRPRQTIEPESGPALCLSMNLSTKMRGILLPEWVTMAPARTPAAGEVSKGV
jgi:hypothetical protein